MRIVVTGAAGFIASHLCSQLLEENHTVIGIDNFDSFYDRKIKEANVEKLKTYENFSFYECDLENQEKLSDCVPENTNVVVHLAAKAGVRPSLKKPLDYVDANLKALVSLMEVMKNYEIKDLVFASSSSIYGECKNIPFKENESFDHAISVYAASKQAGELFTRMYHNLYKFDVINLRFFTVYGEGQRPDLAIHKFLKANLLGEEITLFGDGSMARDYTYVKDTVAGIIGAIKRIHNNDDLYETYNLGNSTPVSLTSLIEEIEEVTGIKCKTKRVGVPAGDVPITFADISEAKKMLDYNPETSLKIGLKNMYEWIKEVYK